MDDAMVERVRLFSRTVTQRVGALDDRFLARGRPLGEARLLWEIGDEGCDVRALRSRLQLDSGYVSRLLRSLESAGLVRLEAGRDDKRVRRATLTKRGSAERKVLDRRSDERAWSLLEPLSERQRERLVSAMDDVERLLTAALVVIDTLDPGHPHAQHCLQAYFTELDSRFDAGFDPAKGLPTGLDEMRPPGGMLCVATLRGEPIGCGALKFPAGEPVLLKRIWVDPTVRGLGVGRRLLDELEVRAAASGSDVVRLETNKTLTEAIAMYRSAGYREVDPFNDELYAHHWFEKHLTSSVL